MSTLCCPQCGAPIWMGTSYPFMAQHTCMCQFNSVNVGRITFAPQTTADRDQGCKPLQQLTEADIRRIVREELERIEASKPSSSNP